jgi:uroporphyrinogen-III decarboxylase
MSLSSRERVLATFAHEAPDRVPIWCGLSAEFEAKARCELDLDAEGLRRRLHDDFRRIRAPYRLAEAPLPPGATCRTVFGVERQGLGYGQPLSHPLALVKTVREVHQYPWPDPACVDVSALRQEARSWHGRYAILGGDWSPFWHDAIDLLGMETLCIHMIEAPALVDAVLQHLVDFYAESSRRIFAEAADLIDIFFFGNDLGSQTGPLIGPALCERFLLPHFKRLIDLGHAYGLKVQMHCCGGFAPLLPALVAAGLDAVHAIQPCCRGMELPALKRQFGRDLVFNGCIDSQHVLIAGTPDSVVRDTRAVLDIMMPGGGYVAGASHDTILEETPVANLLAMVDTVRHCGVYRPAGGAADPGCGATEV